MAELQVSLYWVVPVPHLAQERLTLCCNDSEITHRGRDDDTQGCTADQLKLTTLILIALKTEVPSNGLYVRKLVKWTMTKMS